MAALESVLKREEKGLVLVWRSLEASLRALRRVNRRCLGLGGSSSMDGYRDVRGERRGEWKFS